MRRNRGIASVALTVVLLGGPPSIADDQTLRREVLNAIEIAKDVIIRHQHRDGSWTAAKRGDRFKVGITSLATLALLNAGMTRDDPPVRDALSFLRSLPPAAPNYTYDTSLMIMALVAAHDGARDHARILQLTHRLEQCQIKTGAGAGLWTYQTAPNPSSDGDRSNGQFAVLGLRDAAEAGIPVDRATWRRIDEHWRREQKQDGSWGYSAADNRTRGSMAVAGLATLAITARMLRDHDRDEHNGRPNCCPGDRTDEAIERAVDWVTGHFTVERNPGYHGWPLYYLYGLERAGRLNGVRFFGRHDWYREGARFLVGRQSPRTGWTSDGGFEDDPAVGTSLGLLFLAKGLSPVLINKLKYGPVDPNNVTQVFGDDWNNHPHDVRNITEFLSGRKGWPLSMTSQTVALPQLSDVDERVAVQELRQASILYLTGQERPEFTNDQIRILRRYVDEGGFIFAVANCSRVNFEDGFRDTITRMFPDGDATLQRLKSDHAVFRAEFLLNADSVELHGVDLGCRTSMIYSPEDLSCLWDKWARQEPPGRSDNLTALIMRDLRIGANVIAYATGRQPPAKLEVDDIRGEESPQERIEAGFLQIAKLRHDGGWDAAPRALKNLLHALNQKVGLGVSPRQRNLVASDRNIFNYPILYMHGRHAFHLDDAEREQLRKYLDRGMVLFADACCGSSQFDDSFRDFMRELFPDRELKRIPETHELVTSGAGMGYDIRRVTRRVPAGDDADTLESRMEEGPPVLEGIDIDGRYAVIYSKYDISCALERQTTVDCAGYEPDDAVRIAVNIVLYSMLQDIRYRRLLVDAEAAEAADHAAPDNALFHTE